MKTFITFFSLMLFVTPAMAQKHWRGTMLDEKNQSKPEKPPTAVCNDGSFDYQHVADNLMRQNYCEHHKGVKQFVYLQYVSFTSEKLLTEKPPVVPYKPEEQKLPQYWLNPVVTSLEKSVGKANPTKPWSAKPVFTLQNPKHDKAPQPSDPPKISDAIKP